MSNVCSHLESIEVLRPPADIAGCEDCLRIGGKWVHLRMCMTCGHIGCCDSSPNRHARTHAAGEDHPLVRSAQPGEQWSYCFVDDVMLAVEDPPA